MDENRPISDATLDVIPKPNWTPAVTFLSGPRLGLHVEIVSEHFMIGREDGNNLVIDDKTVSRRHAEIYMRHGRYVLRDLNSKWGTLLNGQKIAEVELKFGDEIEISGTRLKFNLLSRDVLAAPKTRWFKIILIGLTVFAIGAAATLFYFRYQTKQNMDYPGADVLSAIMYHYDKGIQHFNQMGESRESKEKVIEEMKKVIELDPKGKTRFSISARRIIDGLEK